MSLYLKHFSENLRFRSSIIHNHRPNFELLHIRGQCIWKRGRMDFVYEYRSWSLVKLKSSAMKIMKITLEFFSRGPMFWNFLRVSKSLKLHTLNFFLTIYNLKFGVLKTDISITVTQHFSWNCGEKNSENIHVPYSKDRKFSKKN